MKRTINHTALFAVLVCAACALAGCGTSDSPMDARSHAAEGPAAAKVELKPASWEQAQELVAKHQGKIVVFDMWSSSCPPCVKEFPGLVKLQKELPDEVVCISFNCDFIGLGKPEDDSEAIVEFLREQKATIPNLLSTDADEAVFKKANIVSLPVVIVYGKDGKVAKQFEEEFTYEQHVSPLVRDLVKK